MARIGAVSTTRALQRWEGPFTRVQQTKQQGEVLAACDWMHVALSFGHIGRCSISGAFKEAPPLKPRFVRPRTDIVSRFVSKDAYATQASQKAYEFS